MNEAMALAAMNPMVGAAKGDAIIMNTSPDKDLSGGWGSYVATRSIDNNSILGIDARGKICAKRKDDEYFGGKTFFDCSSNIYLVRSGPINEVWDKLIQEVSLPYEERPIHKPSYLYEVFTGHELLSPDQADYDPLLERVYLDKLSKELSSDAGNIEREFNSIKYKKDSHYPMEEKRIGDESDSSTVFPLLSSAEMQDRLDIITEELNDMLNER